MWVARDKDGDLKFFANKPVRNKDYWAERPLGEFCRLNDWLFPELTWNDEPVKVNLSQCTNPNKILNIIRECGFQLSVIQENILYNKLKNINYDTI